MGIGWSCSHGGADVDKVNILGELTRLPIERRIRNILNVKGHLAMGINK